MTTPPVVSITDELIAELEVAANAATPGPWRYEAGEEDTDGPAAWPEVYAGDVAIIGDEGFYGDNEQDESNAEFIARVDPSTILALLAEHADLKRQIAAASTTAESYELFRQEAKRWRDIVRSVANEIPHRSAVRGNAPGHGHDVPGIWDSDNGPLAGKECAWCKTWHSALDAARNIGSGD